MSGKAKAEKPDAEENLSSVYVAANVSPLGHKAGSHLTTDEIISPTCGQHNPLLTMSIKGYHQVGLSAPSVTLEVTDLPSSAGRQAPLQAKSTRPKHQASISGPRL